MLDDDGIFALSGGSLLLCHRLEVHPAFRGQQIGLRLLTHGLWFLHRSDADRAVLEAVPLPPHMRRFTQAQQLTGKVTVAEKRIRARAVRSLVAYYEQIGFRCPPARVYRRKASDAALLYFSFNHRMRVCGAGEFGLPDSSDSGDEVE